MKDENIRLIVKIGSIKVMPRETEEDRTINKAMKEERFKTGKFDRLRHVMDDNSMAPYHHRRDEAMRCGY